MTEEITKTFIGFLKDIYNPEFPIPLHRPAFFGPEKDWLSECIDSNFVSSVGKRVVEFENRVAGFVGAKRAIATVNGTSALHAALLINDVKEDTEVITQALTFIATSNAINYCGAKPVFIDVEEQTLGMSPETLKTFIIDHIDIVKGKPINKKTGKRISACLPMHTFGHPCRIDKIAEICESADIPVVEDSAESLGSWYKGRHTGIFGKCGIFSFNGNKTITTGGGGMIVTDNEELADKLKHLTTTGKKPHPYLFFHDVLAFNYRMPNLNAALGCAQMEQLTDFIRIKREIAGEYKRFCAENGLGFFDEPPEAVSNFWLNAIILEDIKARDEFLKITNENGIMTRPVWNLMNELPMYRECRADDLRVSKWFAERLVNIPSSVPNNRMEKVN